MNKILFWSILWIAGMMVSCSVDDVLAPSDKLNIAIMETVDTPRVVPGDTISFKFIASTSKGKLTRIEVRKQEGDFTPLPDSLKFAMVDQQLGLTIDKEGYLSRPVSTVMMIYPVVMGAKAENIGQTASITFRLSSDQGKSSEVTIAFKVINHRIYTSSAWFYKSYGTQNGTCFYNPYQHKTYSAKKFEENKEKVELVAYQDKNLVNYCMDPASQETEDLLKADGYTYNAAEMRETVMYKLKNVDFDKVTDADFERLDFTGAQHKVTMEKDDVIAYRTSNGRKGILKVTIQSGYALIKNKYQALVK